MMKGWEIMKAVTEGTEYLRENSEAFLPLEPREDYTAYLARVNRAVFSPFTQRLIRAATGLVLRKPITLKVILIGQIRSKWMLMVVVLI